MDEPLAEFLDGMIRDNYCASAKKFSGAVLIEKVDPPKTEEEVDEYIIQGRPVPIEDSADHQLLQSFDRARREYLANPPVPDWNFDVNGTVTLHGNQKFDGDAFQGEIPWRQFGSLPRDRDPELYRRDSNGWWRCVECSHLPDEHYPEPHSGDPDACYECSRCNCGNNCR